MVKTSMACKETLFSLSKELSFIGSDESVYVSSLLALACLMSDENTSSSYPNIGPRSLLHRILFNPKTSSLGFWPGFFSTRKRNDFALTLNPSGKTETRRNM